jgi:hypothetical protein
MMHCLCLNQPEKYVNVSLQKRPHHLILIGTIKFLQPEYTLDLLNMDDQFHTEIIRSKLTRNIAVTFKEVREELIMGMDDLIPPSEDSKWQSST